MERGTTEETLEIDLSKWPELYEEVLCASLVLATLLGKPLLVTHIPGGGLRRGHIEYVHYLSSISTPVPMVDGDTIGSQTLLYTPPPSSTTISPAPLPPQTTITIGPAERVEVIAQALLPVLLFRAPAPTSFSSTSSMTSSPTSPSPTVRSRAGSAAATPGQPAYMQRVYVNGGVFATKRVGNVLVPLLRLMGANTQIETKMFGFSIPMTSQQTSSNTMTSSSENGSGSGSGSGSGKGRAKACAVPFTEGACLGPLVLPERGDVASISIKAYASRVPRNVGDKMVQAALAAIKEDLYTLPKRIDIETFDVSGEAAGSGAWVEVVAKTDAGCILCAERPADPDYAKHPPAEAGTAAGKCLLEVLGSGACVDDRTLCSIIPYMAMAKGTSTVGVGAELTQRVRVFAQFVERFTGAKFEVIMNENGKSKVLVCTGIAYCRHLKH